MCDDGCMFLLASEMQSPVSHNLLILDFIKDFVNVHSFEE